MEMSIILATAGSDKVMIEQGARYLTGDNLKVVWAKFSTLSKVILLYCALSAWHDMQPLLELKIWPRVCPVGSSLSMDRRNTKVLSNF